MVANPEIDLFGSAKKQLARSDEHVAELDRQVMIFLQEKPYKLVPEIDPDDQTYEIFKFKFTKRLPETWTHLAIEALEGLRSVLDQTAYACAIAAGKINPKFAYFPIADDLSGLETGIKGRTKDLPDKIVALFRGFKPYKGGNDTLWALNKLRNSNHMALIPVSIGGANIEISHRTGLAEINAVNPVYDSGKNEIIFGRGKIGEPRNYDVRSSLNICFEDARVSSRISAVGFLYRSASEVRRILLGTEAECRQIRLIK